MSRTRLLALALFLALVALGVTLVEKVPAKAEGPVVTSEGDELVLVFGEVPPDPAAAEEPEAPVLTPEQQPPDVHIVQKGDTLSSIALQRFGSASYAAEIAALNGLDDPDKLRPGDRLRLR